MIQPKLTLVFTQTSLVKLSMCRFALEDYTEAYSDLHDALSLSRTITKSLSDYRQLAEILNNLGCLSYLGGELEKAMVFLREANKIQMIASDNSLYIGSKFSSQSVALNTSVTHGNIGFISLLLQDVTESVTTLETAMRVSLDVLQVHTRFFSANSILFQNVKPLSGTTIAFA